MTYVFDFTFRRFHMSSIVVHPKVANGTQNPVKNMWMICDFLLTSTKLEFLAAFCDEK